MKATLSGNEATTRSVFGTGCLVACANPGALSTEILENTLAYKGPNSSWAASEKVALVYKKTILIGREL